MTEQTTKAAIKRKIKSGDKVKVKNVSNKVMGLTHGTINPERTGIATEAEVSCFPHILERV